MFTLLISSQEMCFSGLLVLQCNPTQTPDFSQIHFLPNPEPTPDKLHYLSFDQTVTALRFSWTQWKKKLIKNIVLFWLLLVFGMLCPVVSALSHNVCMQLLNFLTWNTLKCNVLEKRVCSHVVFRFFMTHILFDTHWL